MAEVDMKSFTLCEKVEKVDRIVSFKRLIRCISLCFAVVCCFDFTGF